MESRKPSPEKGVLHVVVESPAGATTKIKWEPGLGMFALSRPLPLGLAYPHDWGFVPGTAAEDGDPLDAMVLSEGTTFPGVMLRVRPLGVVRLEQNSKRRKGRERNDRLIAVTANAARRSERSVRDLPKRVRDEIERFFINVTFFEDKDAEIIGWGGPQEAWRLVRRCTHAKIG
jgi:inorganic pyrophosphatase